ncbi:MAG: hypothetical protein NC124_20875, partial [Clostridium sp.]|nr:hypothetical protein [Clostridium sp.]
SAGRCSTRPAARHTTCMTQGGGVSGLTDTKAHLPETCRYSVNGELIYGGVKHENEYTYSGERYGYVEFELLSLNPADTVDCYLEEQASKIWEKNCYYAGRCIGDAAEEYMAIVLDVNLLCCKMMNLFTLSSLLNKYGICIESANSIDSWMWDNEKRLESLEDVESVLNRGHIAVLKTSHSQMKDMGIYAEKLRGRYLYTLWFNTEGYSMLDCEEITPDNWMFYKRIIQMVLELNGLIKNSVDVAGVGLETDMCYESDIMSTILKAKGIVIWLLNRRVIPDIPIEALKSEAIDDNMYILQRKNGRLQNIIEY